MYRGKYANQPAKRRRRGSKRAGTMLLSLLLLATLVAGGTLAYLAAKTDPVVNQFTPSHVTCAVTESFDGIKKTNVNVTNTGDIHAYLRVKLVTYRVNEEGKRIGGTAELPEFILGADWVKDGGFYYYTKPVAAGARPATNLTDSMTLQAGYSDADGGKQVVEVMAEAIQADGVDASGTKAVVLAWGVDPETLS